MKYTEEEKKAIEYLKENALVRLNENNKIVAYGNSYKYYILQLLDKQQKEIEEQNKEINEKDKLLKFSRNYINKLEQDLFENANNYVVSKEAIREKIKELKDNRPYLSKFDDWKEKEYTNEDVTNKCVEVLEDLLGDE